ncbi:MAG: helix-turn-helix domain-containing protein [Holosporaceae bacterium]
MRHIGLFTTNPFEASLLKEQVEAPLKIYQTSSGLDAAYDARDVFLKITVDQKECRFACVADHISFAKPFQLALFRDTLVHLTRVLEDVFAIGEFVFVPSKRLLKGRPSYTLPEKEANLLLVLLKDGFVSKEQLLQKVWGYDANISTHTLETHVYKLRQKIEKDANHPTVLVSAPSGYAIRLAKRLKEG